MEEKNLRSFLNELEKKGRLARVKGEVAPEEVWPILCKTYEAEGPALIFENISGFSMPVVSNVIDLAADSFAEVCGFPTGKTYRECRDLYMEKTKDHLSWPKTRPVESGPVKEVILKGDDASFNKLPLFKIHPYDGGPYITLPACITKDLKFGLNMAIYRMMVHDEHTSGIMCNIFQNQGIYNRTATKRGLDRVDCAVAIGLHPAIYLAANTTVPVNQNELEFAGALLGGPVPVVKAETMDIDVPADAEIVLEGEISLNETRLEGPFAEFMGYYEEPMKLPVFRLKCITHRKDAMFQMTTVDHPKGEGEALRTIMLSAAFATLSEKAVTGYRDSWVPESSRGYTAVISIKKRYPGWGRQAIHQAFGIPYMGAIANNVIIVDEDIDPSNLSEIMWSLSTRVDPYYDVIVTKPMGIYPLNPAARKKPDIFDVTDSSDFLVCSKLGIDATLKMKSERKNRDAMKVARPSPEMMAAIEKKWSSLGLPHLDSKKACGAGNGVKR